MICKIHIDRWTVKELPQEAWDEVGKILLGFPEKKEDYYNIPEEQIVDLELIGPTLHQYKVKYEIVGFGSNNMVVKMGDRLRELEAKFAGRLDMIQSNGGIIHVHVPNIGLMLIDEVTHLDDACTDMLQEHLNDGWRILAVCPPNAQRRPDYILGRTKRA